MQNEIEISDKAPREFAVQDNYYLSEFNDLFQERYDGYFVKNTKSKNNKPNKNLEKEDITRSLQSYPSLKKRYLDEAKCFIDSRRKHKYYFHNNIFEELMSTVWHPNNFAKFKYWDPEFNLES